jgi:hypothetical protein
MTGRVLGPTAGVVAWAAAQVLRMHAPMVEPTAVPDPRARWRDLVRADGPTVYRRGQCKACRADGTCELLEQALAEQRRSA